MAPEVTVESVDARPTLVVPAATTWQAFPGLWKELLDEVWACLRANGITRGCPNVMLYLDGVPHVEVGVLRAEPVALQGRVVTSALPAGEVATALHRGPYSELGAAHEAVGAWCAEHGRERAGPSWEIYGPHRDDPAETEVRVSYLLA